jgi:alpha-tubulin suppressor-like RCC1 family protein
VAYCWGRNNHGQIGDGTIVRRLSPVALAGFLFTGVSPGGEHTCGVASSSLLYCWGSNWGGQVGDGTAGNERHTPVAVSGGRKFSAVKAGLSHTCATTTGNEAFCWGANPQGQLGNGSATGSSTPVPVGGG